MKIVIQPWAESAREVIEELNTRETGLTEKEAADRLTKYGNNTFHNKEKTSVVTLFLKQFLSPLIFLLIGAGVLTSILNEWVQTVVIALAVLFNLFLRFFSQYYT